MAANLSMIAPYLLGAGVCAALVATLWFIVLAFRRHILWGLAVLFVPFANLIFLIQAWRTAKRPFFLSLVGVVLSAGGLAFSPQSWSHAKALYAKIALLIRPEPAPTNLADPHTLKLAELRVREQHLRIRKAALKPGDTAAAEALAAEIKAYNVELRALLAQMSHKVEPAPEPEDLWTMDLPAAPVPQAALAGRLGGETFSIDQAWIENGTLTVRHGTGLFPEHEFVIVLNEPEPAGRSFRVSAQTRSEAPQVRVKSVGTNRKQEETKVFNDGYAMRLQFGQVEDEEIAGAIYLCLPDPQKSYLIGRFQARMVAHAKPPETAEAPPKQAQAQGARAPEPVRPLELVRTVDAPRAPQPPRTVQTAPVMVPTSASEPASAIETPQVGDGAGELQKVRVMQRPLPAGNAGRQ